MAHLAAILWRIILECCSRAVPPTYDFVGSQNISYFQMSGFLAARAFSISCQCCSSDLLCGQEMVHSQYFSLHVIIGHKISFCRYFCDQILFEWDTNAATVALLVIVPFLAERIKLPIHYDYTMHISGTSLIQVITLNSAQKMYCTVHIPIEEWTSYDCDNNVFSGIYHTV